MARLYLTLYGVLFLTCALFIAGLVWLPELALRGTIQRYYERALIGAYDLVEERLVARPPAQWDEVIAELKPQFRYGLALYGEDELGGLDISVPQQYRLREGRLIFQDEGEQTRFFKQVSDSDRYLMMVLGPNPQQEEIDQVGGIVYLIESRFLNSDRSAWPDILAGLGQVFKMPLALLSIDDPSLPSERVDEIKAGEIVVLGLEDQMETYFKRLGDSDQVFRAGPFEIPLILRYFNFIILFLLALLIALAVYVWVRPVWRDLNRFDRGVRSFGAGDLDTRLAVRKGSALSPLANAFNAMAERMQRLIHAHRELTGAVSHELRTPIARLRFRMDMLDEPLSGDDRQRHIAGMHKDILELEELVSESLSYSRLDRERPELVLEQVSLGEWLEALLIDLEEEPLTVDVAIERLPGSTVSQIALDSRLMGRAVKNLIRNGRRHARSRIVLSGDCRDGQARIVVEDDGSGVPEQERERIFAPFARLDSARDRESGGVGLGLAIVSQIARWHDGKVWVEASGLGGARFVIAWPVTQS
ncbi:MAG: two-component sensor histidine kinase [Candidatus Thiodiazotropha sp. (ex Dulcina madagascariensis)]|nr:two-component sensor histidine kinase [Candidatus Thiodiazotropha sp. (ex Dulcina madagascariensis)]